MEILFYSFKVCSLNLNPFINITFNSRIITGMSIKRIINNCAIVHLHMSFLHSYSQKRDKIRWIVIWVISMFDNIISNFIVVKIWYSDCITPANMEQL